MVILRKKIFETCMTKDGALSKKMAEVEERNKQFIARQVEASDRDRAQAEKGASPGGSKVEVQNIGEQ